MFRSLRSRFGGGTTVETTVHTPAAVPGGVVDGVVDIVGGEFEQQVTSTALALVARVEVGDGEHAATTEFGHLRLGGAFVLQPGARFSVPFRFPLPLQTPFTEYAGHPLRGSAVGLRTDLEIARSVDKGDLDPLRIVPLPAQERVLVAFERLGFRLKGADLEHGRLLGAALPFHQEVEFAPSAEFAGRVNEVEVTFLAGPQAVEVVLEIDKRGGFLTEGRDLAVRFAVDHAAVDAHDWERVLHEQLHAVARRRGLFG